jgi:hypothetical protein
MKQLSYWASQQIWPARGLVVLCYFLVNVLGIFWAVVLLQHEAQPTRLLPMLCCLTTILAFACYPKRKNAREGRGYLIRRVCDAWLALATLGFVVYGTAEALHPAAQDRPVFASSRWKKPVDEGATANNVFRTQKSEKGFTGFLHRVGKWYQERDTAERVILVILTILLTVALIALWGAVCCGIICDGMEALGYTLFFLGSGGLIFGCVALVRRIIRGAQHGRRSVH